MKYKNGLPFSTQLGESFSDLNNRIKGNKASLAIIDGGVGEGKTTLATHAADYLNSLEGLSNISLDKRMHPQLSLGGKDFMKNLRVCFQEQLPVIVYDEAGDFNRRGALTRFNATLNRIFETFRAFKILVILCLPSFHVLDNDLFDKQIPRLLVHCHDRTQTYGNFRAYGLYRMFYIKEKMRKFTVRPQAYSTTTPNYRGHFLDLDPKRSKLLDELSTKGKLDIMKKSEISMDNLISYEELAKAVNRSIIWCRGAVREIRLKHSRIIDKKKYFKRDDIERVLDYIDTKKN